MCKWCGTRYCKECLKGEFTGEMKEPNKCRVCNQVSFSQLFHFVKIYRNKSSLALPNRNEFKAGKLKKIMSVLFIDPVSRSKSGICSETKGRRGRQEAE